MTLQKLGFLFFLFLLHALPSAHLLLLHFYFLPSSIEDFSEPISDKSNLFSKTDEPGRKSLVFSLIDSSKRLLKFGCLFQWFSSCFCS